METEWKPGTVFFMTINGKGQKTYQEQTCWQMDRFVARMQDESDESHTKGKPEEAFTFAVVSREEYVANREARRR